MSNPPKKQSLPKPKPRTRQLNQPKGAENKYAPKKLIDRPGLGNLRVIDTNRPEYQP